MKKKYIIAIQASMNRAYPCIEIVIPERIHETFEEAEKDIESLFEGKGNTAYKFHILEQYTKE